MVEFIKKNKKIIISSSIFTGISSNNIYCGCCGDTNKKNNTSNTTQNPQQNPTKDEKPQQDPPQNPPKDETERNNIITECENLIVEIKKFKNDYAKNVNKGDTIENLKNFKNELQTDLNTLKNTKPGENPEPKPEKTEIEKLKKEVIKIFDDLIKKTSDKDKELIRFDIFNNILTTEIIKDVFLKQLNSINEIKALENEKQKMLSYFNERKFEDNCIKKLIKSPVCYIFGVEGNKGYNHSNIKFTESCIKENFFASEHKADKCDEKDIFFDEVECLSKSDDEKLSYCIFNDEIYNKFDAKYKDKILKLKCGLYFFKFNIKKGVPNVREKDEEDNEYFDFNFSNSMISIRELFLSIHYRIH